ncbi:lignostilbene-alpha,beta-dioxygenase [Halalkaliarchaeum desulfuricum]|uniref:Lignostilbene-alpha,beta-dioxygenase n=1 Tax=Halalkaliarchaeum desulfuricum TaxID=2055893 RepID=A0A343TI72_9EURY|nr:carotenoid oxygenase family protein [Halalkaliarchaeum desulfuricum]AUX08794.1 lignostilbene-alpha,beta-dioxygenase [Halalkaliarchaeum desulfuricum]
MESKHAVGLYDLDREFGETALGVEGELPDWLAGTLLCNGPGRFTIADGRSVNHWFDGLALVRRFRLDGGSNYVSFAARFLRSEEYESVDAEGRLARDQFGTDPYADVFERLGRVLSPAPTDNASIGFEVVDGSIRAVTETPRGVVVDPETLDSGPTVDRVVDSEATMLLAHTHRDHRRGEAIAVGTRLGWTSEYLLCRRELGASRFETFGRLERERPAYLHSFGLTDGHVVVLESPFRIEPLDLLDEGPISAAFEWTDHDARLLVFGRESGEHVATATIDPCFTFHHVNAFERSADDGGHGENPGTDLVVDLIAYDDAEIVRSLSLSTLRDPDATLPGGQLRRHELQVPATQNGVAELEATTETLYDDPVEFPTVNYGRVNGRPYRYVYTVGNGESPVRTLPDRLCKIDLDGNTTGVWRESDCFPGEPLFVPRTLENGEADEVTGDSADEDDGAVLSIVLDTDHPAPVDESGARSFLLVLDAGSFAELARAPLPCVLPFGFHGQFFGQQFFENGGEFVRSMA